MMDLLSGTAAESRRTWLGLDVAGRRVGVVCDEAAAGLATSAAAARLAEGLVASWIGCERRQVHVAAVMPSGRPVATVRGRPTTVFISVSHEGGLMAAAACSGGGLGLDIVAATAAGPALDAWFTADERGMFPDDEQRSRARVWAAKEAAFKAAGLDEGFRPLAVEIDRLRHAGFRWRVRGEHRRVSGQGVFAIVGAGVVAVAVATRFTDVAHQSRST